MDLGDELVGLPGYDCAGVQPLLSRRIFPTFPETGKDKRRIVFHPDRVWDFASDDLLPFVESIGWDQAAPFLECLSIRGRRINRLKALSRGSSREKDAYKITFSELWLASCLFRSNLINDWAAR